MRRRCVRVRTTRFAGASSRCSLGDSMRLPIRLAPVILAHVLAVAVSSACGSGRTPEQPAATRPETELVAHDRPNHASLCEPSRRFAGESALPCSHDSDCVACGCAPVNREELRRLGGQGYCDRFNEPPAREECVATNGAACCDFACVLVR